MYTHVYCHNPSYYGLCETFFSNLNISLCSKKADKGRSDVPTPPGYMQDPPKEDVRVAAILLILSLYKLRTIK